MKLGIAFIALTCALTSHAMNMPEANRAQLFPIFIAAIAVVQPAHATQTKPAPQYQVPGRNARRKADQNYRNKSTLSGKKRY